MTEEASREHPEQSHGQEEISPEDIATKKRQARINALVLGSVFLLTVMAPYPWNTYAPLLFLIPLLYSIAKKIRRTTADADLLQQRTRIDFENEAADREEPYSHTPSDPHDPRRYKPIE